MSGALAAFSQSVLELAGRAASRLCAIRIAPNRHITGLICEGNLIVTCDQALPAQERYSIVLPNGSVVGALCGARDSGANLAMLTLEPAYPVANPEIATGSAGGMAVIVGADADGSPTSRLTVIHRLARTAEGYAPVLDLSSDRIDPGGLVLDAEGRLIGIVAVGPANEAIVIPSNVIGRMLIQGSAAAGVRPVVASPAPPPLPSAVVTPVTAAADALALPVPAHAAPAPSSGRRAWLGVALQPITVPDALAARAGQSSGRMVVSLTAGGPAEMAGLRVGDVLLALNGTSASGPQALRAFLAPDRIGSTIEIKLLREGNVLTTHLTVALQPG